MKKQGNLCVKIIGVGDGASNIINRIKNKVERVGEWILVNADEIDLRTSAADVNIQVENEPDCGKIAKAISGCNKLIVLTCLGGETGTGIAPVVSELAKDMKIATEVIVTMPFKFEGAVRSQRAENGITALRGIADTFIVISNGDYRKDCGRSFAETFSVIDEAIIRAINENVD